ncbi:MAG TPA: hypothetical protein VK890_05015 [Bacteroidia bacterium]|jgi:hypothetical protein|nr:hypothetical protein [Bacteroidia bacterium]
MAISKNTQANIDDSNLAAYPNGQVKDDDGTGDGFPLIRATTSDIFETFDKLMRLAANTFNNEFDNETNGYQFVQSLVALASKSDYILALTTDGTNLGIATKLGILNLNEKLIVQAAADWTTETHIIGSDAVNLTVAITRQYKAGDYLTMIKTSGGVKLVSIVTADNLNTINQELNYLLAASNVDTIGGTIVNKAVTPASLLYAIGQYLTNATYAAPYYATTSLPGLLSAADKTTIANFNPPVNVGWFSGVDPGGGTVGAFYSPSGNVVTAEITFVGANTPPNANGGYTNVLVTLANAMANTNYVVRTFLESSGTLFKDNQILTPVFVPLSTTTFTLSLADAVGNTQNLKVHIEVIQLS